METSALLAAPKEETAPARHVAVLGSLLELVAMKRLERRLGPIAALPVGRAGVLSRTSETLSILGSVGAVVLARRSRAGAALAGAALLGASASTRFPVFEAGRISARDPKYTVDPQRARLGR